jgi:hypothetical protein
MRPLGRCQMRFRTLALLPTLIVPSWWLADQAISWGIRSKDYQRMAAIHQAMELDCRGLAASPVPAVKVDYSEQESCIPIGRTRPLTETEVRQERHARERAVDLAAYHNALKRKYRWLAWLPSFSPSPDPPPP